MRGGIQVPVIVAEQFDVSRHFGERGTQLVAHMRKKLIFQLVQLPLVFKGDGHLLLGLLSLELSSLCRLQGLCHLQGLA